MRGQLVESPGYMLNYALGAFIVADLRAALIHRYGSFTAGRDSWYRQVSADVYRFGHSRSAKDVTIAVLGRAPSPAALLADLRRIRTPSGR